MPRRESNSPKDDPCTSSNLECASKGVPSSIFVVDSNTSTDPHGEFEEIAETQEPIDKVDQRVAGAQDSSQGAGRDFHS